MPQQLSLSTESNSQTTKPFAERVLDWFDLHGRKDLPWQQNITPYRVWISEIMLQQTQVNTVIPYYLKFMESFPDVCALADAEQDHVLKHWSGLGYYARARNLHKAAQMVRDEHQGNFPTDIEQVIALPGIGKSTAGAILSIACQQSHAILDGNVKRVLARYYAVEGWTGKTAVQRELWEYADALLPSHLPDRTANYTQAMMDLGATVCIRGKPNCGGCPLNHDCTALAQGNPQDYPNSKPKKKQPERSTIMLIVQNSDKEILLYKRPPTGIWGGLWSFPQFDDKAAADDWLQTESNSQLKDAKKLEAITHVFSHFRLNIQPYWLQIVLGNQRVMEADSQLWYNTEQEFDGGLAAPISQLLKSISINSSE